MLVKRRQNILDTQTIEINQNVAYLIGVLHSDGYTYVFNDKKRNKTIMRIRLTIGGKSLPMVIKFQSILLCSFGKRVSIYKARIHNRYVLETSVNKMWNMFQGWKESIPAPIKEGVNLAGAYLAGLIDGDGNINIKRNVQDRKIPQCLIRISSSEPLVEVKEIIMRFFNCKVHFAYAKTSKGVDTGFYLSQKNATLLQKYIYPHLAIPHKIAVLDRFFKMKTGQPGFEPEFLGILPAAKLISSQPLTEAQRPIR